MRVTRVLAVVVAIISGCAAPDTSPIAFDFPSAATEGTEILVITAENQTTAVAFSLSERTVRLPVNLPADGSASLEAMIYAEPPAKLRIPEGAVMPLSEGTPELAPLETYQATIAGGEFGSWAKKDRPSAEAAKWQAPLPCVTFETPATTYGSEPYFRAAARLDGQTALIVAETATSTQTFYLATAAGVTKVDNPLPSPAYLTAMVGAPDRLVVAAVGGEPDFGRAMYTGDPRRGPLTPLPPRPELSTCSVARMDYARDGRVSPAIYVLDACGNLDRLDGETWTHLLDGFGAYDFARDVAWVDPDTLVFSGGDGMSLYRYRDGQVELLPSEVTLDRVETVTTVDGIGTFVGLLGGWALQYGEDGFSAFRGPFIGTVAVASFAAFGPNLLIAGTDGDIQHWVGRTACPMPTYVGVNHNVLALLSLDFGVVAAGTEGITPPRQFYVTVLKAP